MRDGAQMPMPRGAGRATYPNVHISTEIMDFKYR
jgi:hypothetical protein